MTTKTKKASHHFNQQKPDLTSNLATSKTQSFFNHRHHAPSHFPSTYRENSNTHIIPATKTLSRGRPKPRYGDEKEKQTLPMLSTGGA